MEINKLSLTKDNLLSALKSMRKKIQKDKARSYTIMASQKSILHRFYVDKWRKPNNYKELSSFAETIINNK